jgi:hypothetical protein
MWYELFIIGSWWFWGLLLFAFGSMCYFVNYDKALPSTVVLVLVFLALWLFGDFNILKWIIADPRKFIIYLACYFISGVIWSFIKFYLHLHKFKRLYEKDKENWYIAHPKTTDETEEERFQKYQRSRMHVPSFSELREKIVLWMTYWPVSLFWTMLDDPIKRLCIVISDSFIDLYQSMYDRILRGIVDTKE